MVTLATPLAFTYERGSVAIYGNVAPATNGETHREVLGSGDGSRASQEFTLRHPFLTYVPARNERGMASTLQVLVDDIPWKQVDTLALVGPKEHAFTKRMHDDGKTTVIFGDGHHGARLPTGSENVVAIYRTGSGAAFDAPPGKISLLATKPLGVKGVVNPLIVEPGSGPERKDSGRRNASLGVAPLDRLVSVHDYEEFALGFGGVGKASATELWDGRHQVVHVTVTGMDSGPLPDDSGMLASLETALQLSGDVAQPVQVAPREFLFLVIRASVTLVAGFSWDTVSAAIRQRLLDRFGFDARGFGQDVVSSEVVSTVQAVEGVQSVQLLILDEVPETIAAAQLATLATDLGLRQRIHPRLARLAPTRDRILPAQLCVLNPKLDGTLTLEVSQ
jgi:predicted phage baseplate assembly protein